MNLLNAVLYDPLGGAVTKSTTLGTTMIALDTTNLRLAFTIPAHGLVRVRMQGVIHGATTFPSIFLGVLEGSTLRGRQAPKQILGNTAVATAMVAIEADYIVTGLTPGAVNWDAAYGVETLIAATGIKYGGANNSVANDAFGGFAFEVWDPRPLKTALDGGVNVTQWNGTAVSAPATAGIPDINVKNINNVAAATPGASGGILISGSNAGTTTLAALTVTGVTTHTGNVVLSDGLTISAPSTGNRAGLDITGNGTGAALKLAAGATGKGVAITTTAGDGLSILPTAGSAIVATGNGTSKHGIIATGGTAGTSDGATFVAGTGGVDFRANQTGNLTGTVATLTTYTGNTPQTGDAFARIGANGAGLTAIDLPDQTMNITGNITGNVTGSVGSVTGLTAADVGAIKTKTDNLPSDPADESLIIAATDAIMTRIGVAGAGLTALGDVRIAALDTTVSSRLADADYTVPPTAVENATAVLTTQITEGYRANGAAPTLEQGVSEVLAHLGEASISGTVKTINKLDHVTAAETFTLDSATDPTSVTRAS